MGTLGVNLQSGNENYSQREYKWRGRSWTRIGGLHGVQNDTCKAFYRAA